MERFSIRLHAEGRLNVSVDVPAELKAAAKVALEHSCRITPHIDRTHLAEILVERGVSAIDAARIAQSASIDDDTSTFRPSDAL